MRTFGTAIFSVYKKDIVGHLRTGIKTFFSSRKIFKSWNTYKRLFLDSLILPDYYSMFFQYYWMLLSVHFIQPMDISLQRVAWEFMFPFIWVDRSFPLWENEIPKYYLHFSALSMWKKSNVTVISKRFTGRKIKTNVIISKTSLQRWPRLVNVGVLLVH